MFVTYRGENLPIGDGVDVGYSVEKTILTDTKNKKVVIPKRGVTTLVISLPYIDDVVSAEIDSFEKEFASKNIENFELLLVLPQGQGHEVLTHFTVAFDNDGEFADEFGVCIESGTLGGKFAKALFLISRDNILFYKEICKDVQDGFNDERLYMQINKALGVYTGTGCH